MYLGAATRRSLRPNRVARLVLATVLLCAGAGSLGAGAASARAPYPPTPSCALSWSQDSAHDAVLVGSGYEADQPVAVTLYPQAQSLGSYATNSTGAFEAPVQVAGDDSASYLTVTSEHRSCSVVPPPTGPGPTTTPPPSGVGSTPRSSPPGTTSSVGASNSTSSRPGGGASSARSTTPGTAGGGASLPSGSDYPPTRTPGASASGTRTSSTTSSTGPTTTPGSATPGRSDTRSPVDPKPQSLGKDALGVPLAVIVVIAVLLLLAGGLGVLVLTRR